MRKNLTELVFILDRSGSMSGLEADTIGGFNSLLEKQKKEEGEALVSVVLFDDCTEVLYDRVDIRKIEPMNDRQYYVRGCTALLDAVGGAIHHIGNVHKYAREEDVPEKTLFIITTDGMENASRRYSYDMVRKMVDQLEEENPGCFDDQNHTFIDLYMKSGLYPAEIVKRLYRSPKMKELAMGVFEYCKKLSFLRLPETVNQIGERAFMGAGLRELFVPYAASRIEKQAFAGCTELSNIFLSNRITYIAGDAFEGCSPELTICGIADSLPSQTAEMAGIRFQPVFAAVMQGNQCVLQRYEGSFTHVIIPPDVNVIGDAVFRGCGSVKSLVLPPAVGEIGKSAFEDCANLETLTLTNLLMRAGDGAFAGCNSLRQIRIADMSQQYEPKVQLKIHRNFYKVLRTIREDIAAEYAKK